MASDGLKGAPRAEGLVDRDEAAPADDERQEPAETGGNTESEGVEPENAAQADEKDGPPLEDGLAADSTLQEADPPQGSAGDPNDEVPDSQASNPDADEDAGPFPATDRMPDEDGIPELGSSSPPGDGDLREEPEKAETDELLTPPEVDEEDSQSSGVQFRNDRVEAENITQVGQIFYQAWRHPHFVQVAGVVLKRATSLFVPPLGLSSQRERELLASDRRIFVVQGPRHSGRLTTCHYLASRLRSQQSASGVSYFRHPLEGPVPFVHYAQTESLPKGSVLIPEMPLEREMEGVERWDLALHSLLVRRSSYLLLRSEGASQTFADSEAVVIDATVVDLKAVFVKHVERHLRATGSSPAVDVLFEEALQRWAEISQRFQLAAQVGRFYHHLAGLGTLPVDEALVAAVEAAVSDRPSGPDQARDWFRQLDFNERLFALLLSLFQGQPRDIVEDLYVTAALRLRKEGIAACIDPREVGIGKLLEAAGASEQEVVPEDEGSDSSRSQRALFFNDRSRGEEALGQVANHMPLLSLLVEPLIELSEKYPEPASWPLRKVVAEALGRIGAWRFSELGKALDRLMASSSMGTKVMAGTVLGQAFAGRPRELLSREGKIHRWAQSDDPEMRYLAGTALWRVYDVFATSVARDEGDGIDQDIRQALFEALRNLIDCSHRFRGEDRRTAWALARKVGGSQAAIRHRYHQILWGWRHRNLTCVAYAMRMIVRLDPAAVAEQILEWIGEPQMKRNLRDALGLITEQVFSEQVQTTAMPTETRVVPLLQLVPQVLAAPRDHARTVATMMRVLASWSMAASLVAPTRTVLLEIANGSDREAARWLRLAIAEHWSQQPQEVRRLGAALIARAVAIEGFPSELPGTTCCLMLVDASPEALDGGALRTAEQFAQLLRGMVDVRMLPVGATNPAGEIGELDTSVGDLPLYARPRLMLPALEQQDSASVSSVLVLSWGPVLDRRDVRGSAWASRLLLAIAGGSEEETDEDAGTVLAVSKPFEIVDLGEIETRLTLLRARQLATMSPDLWRPALKRFLGVDLEDELALEKELQKRIDGLDDASTFEVDDDSRSVLCAVLWWARKDVASATSALSRWLSEPSTEDSVSFRPRIAEAGYRMLLRLFACADPLPSPQSHACLLDAARDLVERRWGNAALVLFALRSWLEDEAWRSYLFREPQRGRLRGILREIASAYDAELLEYLESWREPLPAALWPGAGEPPAAVADLAEEMALLVAVTRSKPLPALAEGRRYGLVLVGADGDDLVLRRILGHLTTELVAQGRELLSDVTWLVYRCGRLRPSLIGTAEEEAIGKEDPMDSLFRDEVQRPELLAPLLALHTPARVRFALLLQTEGVVDAADLAPGPWLQRVHAFPLTDRARTSGNEAFSRVPEYRSRREDDGNHDERCSTTARQILHHLSRVA